MWISNNQVPLENDKKNNDVEYVIITEWIFFYFDKDCKKVVEVDMASRLVVVLVDTDCKCSDTIGLVDNPLVVQLDDSRVVLEVH